MIETFYKEKVPDNQWEQYEFQTLLLMAVSSKFFIVTQHQGWWDDGAKESKMSRIILENTEDPLPEAEAWSLYNQQRDYLLRTGFNHTYQRDVMTGDYIYKYLPPPTEKP